MDKQTIRQERIYGKVIMVATMIREINKHDGFGSPTIDEIALWSGLEEEEIEQIGSYVANTDPKYIRRYKMRGHENADERFVLQCILDAIEAMRQTGKYPLDVLYEMAGLSFGNEEEWEIGSHATGLVGGNDIL